MSDHLLNTMILDEMSLQDATCSEQVLNTGRCQNNSGVAGIIQHQIHQLASKLTIQTSSLVFSSRLLEHRYL